MNLNLALKSERLCRAITGMSVYQFDQLVTQFEWNYLEFEKKQIEKREKDRFNKGVFQRKSGAGRPKGFESVEEMLFSALVYLKVYPTYDLMEFLLGIPRSTCHRNIPVFFDILEQTLNRSLVLPKRKISSLDEFLEAFPEVLDSGNPEIFIDSTERPVYRSKKIKTQNKRFSGKKKMHTKKHVLVTDKTKKIKY